MSPGLLTPGPQHRVWLPTIPTCLQSWSIYSLTHKLGWDPFSTQLFVWEIPQILSKWPASPSCLSGCVSIERISLETVLQGSWISPSCKADFLLRLPESLSLERCLIIPKLLAGKSWKCLCKLGRQEGFVRFTLPCRWEGGAPTSLAPSGHQVLLLALYFNYLVSTS